MIVGIDEVGRGALAGPLCVAVVALENTKIISEIENESKVTKLKDSKKLTKLQRERVFEAAKDKIIWSVGQVDPVEIDRLGLTKAVTKAVQRAFAKLEEKGISITGIKVDAGIIHGHENTVPSESIVRGDEKVPEIMLASIMAKIHRRLFLRKLDY